MQLRHLLLPGLGVDPRHDLVGLVPAALHAQPPGRVGHEEHPDAERDAGDHRRGEHRPPAPVGGEEDVVQDVGQEDPARDGQLLEDDQPAADLAWGQLGDVGGHDHRRRADGHADGDPEHDEPDQARRQRRGHRADGIEHRQPHQREAAADRVGQLAAEDAADDRSDEHGGDRKLLAAGTEMKAGLQQVLGAGDDADVVAEQHPADRRHPRDQIGVARGGPDHVPPKRVAEAPSVVGHGTPPSPREARHRSRFSGSDTRSPRRKPRL